MKIKTGPRASVILYNFLVSNSISGTVLIPANICETVPAVYLKAGLKIVFMDIEEKTLDISETKIQEFITIYGITVLHYNHAYGCMSISQREKIKRLKYKYPDLIIVEDCCLCIPEFMNKSTADLIIYSTGHTKVVNINTGGYCFLNDKWNYKKQVYEYIEDDNVEFEKIVKKCHEEIQPVDLLIMKANWLSKDFELDEELYFAKVEKQLESVIKHKKNLNSIYKGLPGSMSNNFNVWRWNLLVENPNECITALFENGLYCSKHYMSLGNGYFSPIVTPVCDYLYRHVINLFNDFCYTEEQAIKTKEILSVVAKEIPEGDLWKL